ncbi:hypothetical protein DUNSADRAFT_8465 [Dunaliella salina]|uniref:Encoded protein n=1 Tax=Dunaliella salina TaxID=3046 RepID=A0ABQ7GJE8_DUNSA|nr:hypothetical protein DUNSADRAFT_8465 [Dunaliella salina]|eukprot:KAF5834738.1 hypothetical protein DUNSADRAFT_8465 [Dunaliella salina]
MPTLCSSEIDTTGHHISRPSALARVPKNKPTPTKKGASTAEASSAESTPRVFEHPSFKHLLTETDQGLTGVGQTFSPINSARASDNLSTSTQNSTSRQLASKRSGYRDMDQPYYPNHSTFSDAYTDDQISPHSPPLSVVAQSHHSSHRSSRNATNHRQAAPPPPLSSTNPAGFGGPSAMGSAVRRSASGCIS